jgi:hypothetical protein
MGGGVLMGHRQRYPKEVAPAVPEGDGKRTAFDRWLDLVVRT